MQKNTDNRYQKCHSTLTDCQQEHLLHFYNELNDSAKNNLLTQIENLNWPRITKLIQSHVLQKPQFKLPANIDPPTCYPNKPTPQLKSIYAQARQLGEQLITQGKVAAFTVAGGQGTRLGWPGPKGTYPATPINNKPLFQIFADFLKKTELKYDRPIPWYIMTSPENHAETQSFFHENNYLGLDKLNIIFFTQGTMPSIGFDGKILLSNKDSLALNPDGHGGSLLALWNSGAIKDMQKRGVEQISYFQVDNPNVFCIDPLFLGLHAANNAQMSSKMIPKSSPTEKVGNFCSVDNRVTVIEYSDLPDKLANQRTPDNKLRFSAGSIAIHLIAVDFVNTINAHDFALPVHRADKKVNFIDLATGKLIKPDKPNAVKLETFVFDALPLCQNSIIYETNRLDEFAPIKNATGPDSIQTSKQLQSERAAKWLKYAGVLIPVDEAGQPRATIELSHLTAIEINDLKKLNNLPHKIEPDSEITL